MSSGLWVIVGLGVLVGLAAIVTLPGWIAAGIWGMHIFIKAICIFWLVAAVLAVICMIRLATDPYSS